ncbi:MAG: hypothetical protein GC203_10110 [Phenylobacterium sp.]|uniref:hypothetical protein n=1 Tax=Phenylobacterium sp. TaxID=1871053 RepID=UPI0025E047D6|nr:hypothetical protein [Phenylobacterium sp.]MBI1198204.1 hypothetical protein [Phenylobacterium sp.]
MSSQTDPTEATLLRRVAVHLTAFVVAGGLAGGLLTAAILVPATLGGQTSAPAILAAVAGAILLSVMFGAPAAALTGLISIALRRRSLAVWYYVMTCAVLGSVAAGALFALPQLAAHLPVQTSAIGLWGLAGGLGGLTGGWITRARGR